VEKLLTATALSSCTFDIDLSPGITAACYGPALAVSDHPDAGTGSKSANLPTGDLGLWSNTDSSTGLPCAAAQIDAGVDEVRHHPFLAQLISAAAVCVMQTTGISFPAVGASITFTTAQRNDLAGTANPATGTLTPSSVVVTGIRDSAGNAGWRYEVSGTLKSGTLNLTFFAGSNQTQDSAGVERGKIFYEFVNPSPGVSGGCPAGSQTTAGHLTYNYTRSTNGVVIQADYANFCGASTPVNRTTYEIGPTDAFHSTTNPDGWASDYTRVLMSYNTSTLVGNYVYVWQAGQLDGNTRVFNATISSSTSAAIISNATVLSGTGYFGFGGDITKSSTSVGTITGMICNWTGPGAGAFGSKVVQSKAQKQTFSNSGSAWTAVSNNIRYAPVNACSYNPATSSAFRYNTTAKTFSNDYDVVKPATTADTESLINLSAVSFSVPTPPSF
jgi:hypothetical protein